ncbi:sulfatase [Paenibacillus sp. JSM ZJ436]|uniref:sulfatase n=1 Tax=Paenibacillus sp. JSM ZJ436 TaxID=3376190 RepID=UPI0037978EDF
MNIIYLHTHDMGRWIEPYGAPVPAPNMMEFANNSVMFRNAYCAGPTCSPSRTGLLSGMAPHTVGMFGLAHRGFQWNDYETHLSCFLKRNGYETALCGIQHEAPHASMLGYEIILGDKNIHMRKSIEEDRTWWDIHNAKSAAEYLREPKTKPFFLSMGLFYPHRNFPKIEEDIKPDYVMTPFMIADTPGNRADTAGYLSAVRVADKCVGIIMEALVETGLDQETMVILTTDHGIAYPNMKCNLTDSGIGVALMLQFPGNKRQGEVVDSLVSQLDLYPTICDWLGIKQPDWLQGLSLLPLLNKETDIVRNELFAEVNYHASYEPMRCVRTLRYKYIVYYEEPNIVLTNIDGSHPKSFLIDIDWMNLRPKQTKAQLYDLFIDPLERTNLIDESNYSHIREELHQKLVQWMEQTEDPLLDGPILAPEGSTVTPR